MSLAEWWRPDGGLDLPTDITYERWEELGGVLVAMEKGILWAIGDWWRYGEHRFGDRAAQAAPTGYALGTLRAAAWVAERFPKAKRDPDLPWSFYRDVSALPEDEAATLLAQAKAEGLTRQSLRTRIQGTRSRLASTMESQRARRAGEAERFPVIIAEPPWHEMTLDDVCDFTVPAATQAVLFLWAPVTRLNAALSVVEAWGFRYQAHLVWPMPGDDESPYTDLMHELVLVASRGQLFPMEPPGSLLEFGAPNRRKQDKLAEMVAKMYPDLAVYEVWPPPRFVLGVG
jgi:hypothetical protein